MPSSTNKVTAVFWDLGGVLLTNAWGDESRAKAAQVFHLDFKEFEYLHESLFFPIERGEVGFDEYLDRVVFNRPRSFTKENFKEFMFAESQPYPETLAILRRMAQSNKFFLGVINNESMDLNAYRIGRFGLKEYFPVFFSSCYLGVRKPDEAIYRTALEVCQRRPEESAFIDDRKENVEGALRCGMRAIHYQNPRQLMDELANLGIQF